MNIIIVHVTLSRASLVCNQRRKDVKFFPTCYYSICRFLVPLNDVHYSCSCIKMYVSSDESDSRQSLSHTHTHMHTHMHIEHTGHTQMHTDTHTYAYTHICIQTHTLTHTQTHILQTQGVKIHCTPKYPICSISVFPLYY